jgi:hypothetical protein
VARVFIGTSGWHYKRWKGPFYPPDLPASKMLDFYAKHFETVEVNNSFYRQPSEAALAGWRDSTPGGVSGTFSAAGRVFGRDARPDSVSAPATVAIESGTFKTFLENFAAREVLCVRISERNLERGTGV